MTIARFFGMRSAHRGTEPSALSSPARSVCAHGPAGGESLLQAASGYSNALRRVGWIVERRRHLCRGRRRCASEIHEVGQDANVLAWKRRLLNIRNLHDASLGLWIVRIFRHRDVKVFASFAKGDIGGAVARGDIEDV